MYFENEDLEVSLLYDICTTCQKIVPSSHDVCVTCKCSPRWGGACNVMKFEDKNLSPYDISDIFKIIDQPLCDICLICNGSSRWDRPCGMIDYESENFGFILSLYDKYMAYESFRSRDGIQSTIYHGTKLFDSVFSSGKRRTTYKYSQERRKTCKFKYKTPLHQYLLYFHCCSVFLTISECNNLECSFHRSFMKKHDYAIYWLEQYLIYISIFVIYSYCILTGKIRKKKSTKIKHRLWMMNVLKAMI